MNTREENKQKNTIQVNETNQDDIALSTVIEKELVIIGSGPGGYVAALYAAKKGLKVTLIEKGKMGGTCLNWGCIPTKSFVKTAKTMESIQKSELFGIDGVHELTINMHNVVAQKNKVVNQLVSAIEVLMKKNKIEVIRGHASFVDDQHIQVDGETPSVLRFKDCIVATGSSISSIPIPGMDQPFVLTSTEALEEETLPASITIVGGGVIGMEFAFIYRKLGVMVTVVEFLDSLIPMMDADVAKELERQAKKAGIKVLTSTKVTNMQQAPNNQAIIRYEGKKGEGTIECEKVLVAVGRHPNVKGLRLENTNISLNDSKRGIQVDDRMRTSVDHVYAVGDVTDIMQLAHVASAQGMVAVDNILKHAKTMSYDAVPSVIFTFPEIAVVGLSEKQAKQKNMDIEVSKASYKSNGKALTEEQTNGFVKLIVDQKTRELVGGAIVGADASSLISTLVLAVNQKIISEQLMDVIFAHPTTSEVIFEAAFGFEIGGLHQS